MRTKFAILSIATISLIVMACSMPHVGMGPSIEIVGDSATPGSGGVAGCVSVVNDEARNVAVYINEQGARIDVAAEESPGGPLVTCVQMTDYKVLPPSGDSEALPVKAIVVGMREDGTPGVWEINPDDSIDLPQPEQGDDGGARCIVGAKMTTMPEGLQMRYGWQYRVKAMSDDGKLIVGYAEHPRGAHIDGVQLLPGTKVALYWRVYRLPHSRFCIVSPPRIIGTFEKQPIPARWRPEGHDMPAILSQLKMFFIGKLESYLIIDNVYPTSVITESPGVYIVKSPDQDNYEAAARIDQTGVKVIFEVPDLEGKVAISPPPTLIDDPWDLSASVSNLARGTASAQWTLDAWFSTIDPSKIPDPDYSTDATGLYHNVSLDALGGNTTLPAFPIGKHTVNDLLVQMNKALPEPGVQTDYYVFARVRSVPKDYEGNLANNDPVMKLTVVVQQNQEEPPNLVPSLTISAPSEVHSDTLWSLDITVVNIGEGEAQNVILNYYLSYDDKLSTDDHWMADKQTKLEKSILPGKDNAYMATVGPMKLSDYEETGTHFILVTAKADLQAGVPTASVKLSAYYNEVIVDTYKSNGPVVGGNGPGTMLITLFKSKPDGSGPDTSALGFISSADLNSYIDNSQIGYPYLDWYISERDLEFPPNTTLWVQIYGNETVPYAIRLLTKADPVVTGTHTDWYFTLSDQEALVDLYELDDATTLPANMPVLSPQGKLHRALNAPPDYDWVKIYLP